MTGIQNRKGVLEKKLILASMLFGIRLTCIYYLLTLLISLSVVCFIFFTKHTIIEIMWLSSSLKVIPANDVGILSTIRNIQKETKVGIAVKAFSTEEKFSNAKTAHVLRLRHAIIVLVAVSTSLVKYPTKKLAPTGIRSQP
jgi:hypothetical protein